MDGELKVGPVRAGALDPHEPYNCCYHPVFFSLSLSFSVGILHHPVRLPGVPGRRMRHSLSLGIMLCVFRLILLALLCWCLLAQGKGVAG